MNLVWQNSFAQPLQKKMAFTKQDTLRGSITPERTWWNVLHYNINIDVHIEKKEISGYNQLTFEVVEPGKNKIMQIDLQEPMVIEKVMDKNTSYPFKREGNVYWIDFGERDFHTAKGKINNSIYIYFKGKPRVAVNPPWDGGWIWTKDAKGRPWVTVACQGLGASVWYPCKDYQGDEPEEGAMINVTVPSDLVAVANGREGPPGEERNGKKNYSWRVASPINNYNIVPYIGHYVKFSEVYKGEKDLLSCDYWVLDYNLEKARKQFERDVKRMLKAFEYWFGPYPFYEDGFKLVESPHLGMEHQSAIAYGNRFTDGYMGMDLSGSGWGKKWDYIIIHESGHEWFANNITTNDIADMWIHEGFTMYSEVLFIEYHYGKKAADEYCLGIRNNIANDKPLIGPYGVNQEGSGDMYNKGANLLHTIRQVINDDELFRNILRGLNKDFYHKTVDSKDVEDYFSKKSGKDLSKIFDQYLRTTQIPVLEYKLSEEAISYRWTNCIDGFNMPVKIKDQKGGIALSPTTSWQTTKLAGVNPESVPEFDKLLYMTTKQLNQ
jgi:aminopeptidase N